MAPPKGPHRFKSSRPTLRALVTALACFAPLFVATFAQAEICPDDQPSWIRGRVVVAAPNLGQVERGVGEIFVYAHTPGASAPGARFIAVSDQEGHFCIRDMPPGRWILTSFEPFHFRPFVMELDCTSGATCDAGTVALDTAMVRISDDYVDFGGDWWGGPWAQSVRMPAGSQALAKITIRSGAGSTNEIRVLSEPRLDAPSLASAWLQIPNNPGGGRGSAFFEPGQARVVEGQELLVVLEGGSAPWRVGADPYPGGQMFKLVDGGLEAVAGQDMSLALDVDGPDGLATSHLNLGGPEVAFGSVVIQSFTARSYDIQHVSAFTGEPSGARRIQASIHASPDGPAIGPVKETVGLAQQGVALAWLPGAVPVEPGQRYYLKLTFPEGQYGVYRHSQTPGGTDPAPGQTLTADGNPVGGAIWGRVMGAALPPEDDPVEPPDAGVMDATNDAAPPTDDIQNDDAAQSDDTTNSQDSAVADAPPTQNDANDNNPDDPNLQDEQTPRTLTKGCACQQPGNAPSPMPLWPALLLFGVLALHLTQRRRPNQT